MEKKCWLWKGDCFIMVFFLGIMDDVKENAILIVKKLVREGFTAYFAGGCVRDELMGHPSSDIDIATNAPPSKILDIFPHTIPVGIAFGVVIVVMGGHAFEVSTFRRDVLYINGRSPESIELSNPEEDAIRRDFTINGLFFDPLENCIYDYVGGREDILKGVIRAIGKPSERFFEDRLRMIRAIRFSARFGFHIDQETEDGIFENAMTLLPAVAMERIWQEFSKMSKQTHFIQAIIDLHRLELLPTIFPDLKDVHLNTIKSQVDCFKKFPENASTILYLLQLFPNFNEEDVLNLCSYLKVSTHETKLGIFYHRYKDFLMDVEKMDKKDLVYFYANPFSQIIMDVQAAKLNDELQKGFLKMHEKQQVFYADHIQRVQHKKPLITGVLLAEHGILKGKKMGALLKEAEMLSITYNLTDKNAIIELLKQSTHWK